MKRFAVLFVFMVSINSFAELHTNNCNIDFMEIHPKENITFDASINVSEISDYYVIIDLAGENTEGDRINNVYAIPLDGSPLSDYMFRMVIANSQAGNTNEVRFYYESETVELGTLGTKDVIEIKRIRLIGSNS